MSLPAALVAQILDAVRDDDLPSLVTVPLALVVLAGAAVGGWFAVRRRAPVVVAAAVGAVALGLVVGLGVARDAAADEDVQSTAVPAAMVAGAGLGAVGGALAAWRAGRTRP